MKMFMGAPGALRTATVAISLLVAGCGSNLSTQQTATGGVAMNPQALLASIGTGLLQPAARSLGGWEWGSFINSFGALMTGFKYPIEMQKITYQSTGADGQLHAMTGLLILPTSLSGAKPSVPILMYQHGTEPFRQYSPSQFLAHLGRPADYPEVMVAAAIASTGYAVAMADYEGMGDNTSPQPYVHGTS